MYCELVQHGKENIEAVCDEAGEVVTVKEKRDYDNGTKSGNIVIRVSVVLRLLHPFYQAL